MFEDESTIETNWKNSQEIQGKQGNDSIKFQTHQSYVRLIDTTLILLYPFQLPSRELR